MRSKDAPRRLANCAGVSPREFAIENSSNRLRPSAVRKRPACLAVAAGCRKSPPGESIEALRECTMSTARGPLTFCCDKITGTTRRRSASFKARSQTNKKPRPRSGLLFETGL
jgi:hypothetical protein